MRRVFLLTLATVLAGTAAAQGSNNYGSPYTRFGLGERLDFSSSQAAMMGGAGTALRSLTWNGLANPALWADQTYTRFALSAEARTLRSTDASDATSQLSGGGIGAFQLGFPLLQQRLGVNVAYRPFSRVDYRVVQDSTFLPDEGEPIPYRVNFEGNGGLQLITAGLGARVTPGLHVGAALEAYFGVVEYLQRTEFPENDDFRETRTTRATRLRGATGRVGVLLSKTGVFGAEDAVSLGAALSLPATLNGERTVTIGVSLDQDTLFAVEEGSVRLPMQVAAGVSWTQRERWSVAADVRYEPWSDFESDFAFAGVEPDGSGLRDRLRIGGGFQLVPAGNDRTRGYFARTAYRLGAYTERAYVAPTGRDLTTVALTGGFSFPALQGARLDVGVEAGMRGVAEGLLVRDQFLRGTVTVNFGERWFQRRRLG